MMSQPREAKWGMKGSGRVHMSKVQYIQVCVKIKLIFYMLAEIT